MPRLHLDEDIRPLSAFRADAARFVKQLQETKRPLVLTQRGLSAAVVLDVGEYERMLRELERLRAVQPGDRVRSGIESALDTARDSEGSR